MINNSFSHLSDYLKSTINVPSSDAQLHNRLDALVEQNPTVPC